MNLFNSFFKIKIKAGITLVELIISVSIVFLILGQVYFIYNNLQKEQLEKVKFSDITKTFQLLEHYLRQDLKIYTSGFKFNNEQYQFYRLKHGKQIDRPEEAFIIYEKKNNEVVRKVNGKVKNRYKNIDDISIEFDNNIFKCRVYSGEESMEVLIFSRPLETIY
ncbi:MAG: hypothetical protein ACQESP_02270 [Candidatus Muiribacteriota bacterium]